MLRSLKLSSWRYRHRMDAGVPTNTDTEYVHGTNKRLRCVHAFVVVSAQHQDRETGDDSFPCNPRERRSLLDPASLLLSSNTRTAGRCNEVSWWGQRLRQGRAWSSLSHDRPELFNLAWPVLQLKRISRQRGVIAMPQSIASSLGMGALGSPIAVTAASSVREAANRIREKALKLLH
jgi:hypothetical protein